MAAGSAPFVRSRWTKIPTTTSDTTNKALWGVSCQPSVPRGNIARFLQLNPSKSCSRRHRVVESISIQRTLVRRGVVETCKIAVAEPYVSRATDLRCQEGKRNEPEEDGKAFEAQDSPEVVCQREEVLGYENVRDEDQCCQALRWC